MTSKKEREERLVAIFFFLFPLFLVIGGVNGLKEKIAYYNKQPHLWDESLTWPTIKGTITSSRVHDVHRYEDTTLYFVDLTYEYSVNGQQYVSDNYDFWASDFTRRYQAQDTVDKYPSGMAVNVHYDPDHPENAVLIPGCLGCRRSPFILWELIAIVSGSLVLLGYLVSVIRWLRRRFKTVYRSITQ